ncbi:tetratricopeptide repeat protein [Yinghuangia sp. YIM S09857]|uniref:tetratricopeptide repeat protein n=1 Tax=Yinghuangia sp. YIM S09857 TaxID=3436929 RepID=UPI003F53259F
MLRVRLAAGRRYVVGDEEPHPFTEGREFIGWDQGMSERQTTLAARAWWAVGPKAERERFAVVVGGGRILQTIRITGWAERDGRRAFAGDPLPAEHPVAAQLVGGPDPVPTGSRNPVAYFDDPLQACGCGCGETVAGRYAAGHDHRALFDAIGRDFGGDTAAFLDWYAVHRPAPAEPVADALRELASLRTTAGDFADAERLYLAAADVGDTDALRRLARLRSEAGDLDGAERLARAAADAGDLSALSLLASLREESGAPADAFRLYREAEAARQFAEDRLRVLQTTRMISHGVSIGSFRASTQLAPLTDIDLLADPRYVPGKGETEVGHADH